jgi:hypothetical protein
MMLYYYAAANAHSAAASRRPPVRGGGGRRGMDPGTKATIEGALARANHGKGWVTRHCQVLDELIGVLADNPSKEGIERVRNKLTQVEAKAAATDEDYATAITREPDGDKVRAYTERQMEMEEAVTRAQTRTMMVASAAEAALRPPVVHGGGGGGGGGGGYGGRRGRLQEGLKPSPLLNLATTPVQMSLYKTKFLTYFRRSEVDTWPEMVDQHQVFFGTVDAEVAGRVMRDLSYNEARPVLKQNPATGDSLEELLDKLFLEEYPTFGRRLEFFHMRQQEGESVGAFTQLLEDRAKEADIESMHYDDHIIFRMLTGVSNEGLLKEWRRLENPTLLELRHVQRVYEASKKQEKAMKKSKEPARAARAKEKEGGETRREDGGGGRPRSGSRAPSIGGRPVPIEWRNRCLRCGLTTHLVANCSTARTDAKCSSCGRVGHLAAVCITSWEKSHQEGGKAKVKATEETSGSETEEEEPSRARTVTAGSYRCGGATAKEVTENKDNQPTPTFKLRCQLAAHKASDQTRKFSILATPDSGATRTIISADLVEKYRIPTRHTNAKLFSAKEGERMECSRKVKLAVNAPGGPSVNISALVSNDLRHEILVSWHDLIQLGILPAQFPTVVEPETEATAAAATTMEQDVQAADVDKLYEAFADVLREELDEHMKVKGPAMKIRFKKGMKVTPVKRLTARTSKFFLRDMEDKLLEKLLKAGVLGRLDGNTVTDWLSRGHFLLKPCGKKVRLVTDYMDINKFIDRPVHPFPRPDAVFRAVRSESKWFAKLDALHGYFQIPLDKESQLLTAFLLPQGRFFYKVAPMGLNPSGDWWCQKSDEALVGLEGVTKMVDDILVQAETREELFTRIESVLERCREHGIVLSKDKLEIGQSVKFAGHIVSDKGVSPDPEKLGAVADFPAPSDITSLRSFLGMVNQLGNYLPDLAHITEKMRGLLRKGVAWLWTPEHQMEFDKAKSVITSSTVVSYFDPNLPSTILTDASRVGLGYALVQHDVDGKARLIGCGSRALNSAESRYAPVELEMLGVEYATSKLEFYLRGSPRPFTIVTDHKPLVGNFLKPLGDVPNPRLQRLRLRMVGLNVKVEWQPGKDNLIADALSRAPVFGPAPLTEEEEAEEAVFVRLVTEGTGREGGLPWLCRIAGEDEAYQEVARVKSGGLPLCQLPDAHPARQYTGVWERISTRKVGETQLLVCDAARLVVPAAARSKIIDLLHLPHAGLVKTRKAAAELYYWHGMNAAIADRVSNCDSCVAALPSKPLSPLTEVHDTEGPMDSVGMDLFAVGRQEYLLMVDRYSGFPWVHKLTKTDSAAVVRQLERWFSLWGYPGIIRSDGGPQFASAAFRAFCWDRDVTQETSSPYNPSSNGLAEAAVKNCKKLLLKCIAEDEDYQEALLEFRNCPRADGYSPAQLMFGRRMRTRLPVIPGALASVDKAAGKEAREETSAKARDRSAGRPAAEEFGVRDKVIIQDKKGAWSLRGEVLSRRQADAALGSSYTIFLEDSERVTKRNARFIRLVAKADRGEGGSLVSSSSDPVCNYNILSDDGGATSGILRRSDRLKEKKGEKVCFAG